MAVKTTINILKGMVLEFTLLVPDLTQLLRQNHDDTSNRAGFLNTNHLTFSNVDQKVKAGMAVYTTFSQDDSISRSCS